MDPHPPDDATPEYMDSLLQAARDGSPEALGELLERFRYFLRVLAHQWRPKEFSAKFDSFDLVQSTFLFAHKHFTEFNGQDVEALLNWLAKILKSLTVNEMHFLRRRKRDATRERPLAEAAGALNASDDSLLDRLCREETRKAVRAALRHLPKTIREVLELRHIQGMSIKEIARRLHLAEDVIRERLRTSQRWFRSEWRPVHESRRAGRKDAAGEG